MINNQNVVLVTGASSGIGKCCAEYLSQQGFRVYGTSRRTESTHSAQGPSKRNFFQMIPMDVTEDSSVNQAVDHILDRELRLDVGVNNAGFGIIGSLEDTIIDEAKFQRITTDLKKFCKQCGIRRTKWSGSVLKSAIVGFRIAQSNRQSVGWVECNETQHNPR
jgi:NADP-dependent 3-hydroxy acid dehydrogenase YdfG